MTSPDKPTLMGNTVRCDSGFTLIELMVVVAIVSILAVIAIPVYLDYVVRSKTSEGMVFAAEAKTSVTEYYYSNGRKMPESNQQSGLPLADDYNKAGGFIERLELSSSAPFGVIIVTFNIPGSAADGQILRLIPATVNGLVGWTCKSPTDGTGVPVNQAPPSCRG
jgi:type IV pilus assembly protein PilA